MNKAWRLVLVCVVSMAIQGQSLACSGAAIGSIGSSSVSPPAATAGVQTRPGLPASISNAQIVALMTPPFKSETSELTEFQKELDSAVSDEYASHFAPESVAPIIGIANSFVKFSASLANYLSNPTPEKKKDMEVAGVEFGLATTGTAIAVCVVAAVGVVPGTLVSIGLAVASHYGAVAIIGSGGLK